MKMFLSKKSPCVFLIFLSFAFEYLNGQRPTLNDITTITNSIGPWNIRLPERFMINRILPFIRQFRGQLNPLTEINWMNGEMQGFYPDQQQNIQATHVDLDPPEQRPYRNGPVSNLSDLGGMILRELWRKAHRHCLHCAQNGRGQCILVNPNCGYPYQLFDDQAQQIYCSATIWKNAGQIQLRARMQCQTYPATPTMMRSVIAASHLKDWRYMCVNCVPRVYAQLNGNFANGGQMMPIWKNNNNRNNGYLGNGGWPNNNENALNPVPLNGQRPNNGILRIRIDQKYSRIYQINNAEGQQIARFINRVRAKIARGEAPNLPVAAGMNQIKWKSSLASKALKQMYTRDNDPVNIIDLEFAYLIPGGQQRQNVMGPNGGMADPMDFNGMMGGGVDRNFRGMNQANRLVSARGTNYVDLDAQSLLLWTVRNYLEMFTNQQGLNCSTTTGVCKATCRKGSQRGRVEPWQRTAKNSADFHCYPYELLYDRAHSIGCAVKFFTKQRTHLQAKLVCVIEHQYGLHGSVHRMLHRHNVFKVGRACSRCEHTHYCDNLTKLCVARNAQQRGYEPIGQLQGMVVDDGFGTNRNGGCIPSANCDFGRQQFERRYGEIGKNGGNFMNNNGNNRMLGSNGGGIDRGFPGAPGYPAIPPL